MKYDVMFVGGSFPMPMGAGSVNYVYRLLSEFKEIPYIVYTGSYGGKANDEFDKEFDHPVIRSKYCRHVLEPFSDSFLKKLCYYIISIIEITYYIIKFKPKLVYFTEISFSVYAYAVARIFRKFKFGLFTYAEEIQLIKNDFGYKWLIPKVLRDADMILTVCDYTHNMLNEIVNVDNKIFKIVPSIPYNGEAPKKEVKRDASPIKLLTVARLSERKGHNDVIDALVRLKNDCPEIDFEYRIVGKGEYEEAIFNHIKETGAEGFVKLLGKVSDEELESEYMAADIFVLHHKQLPNGDTEGCPTVFLEASWYSLPVIGGEAGGVSDAIQDKLTGFICHIGTDELYDNIKSLLFNSDKRLEMGTNGHNYAAHFTASKQSISFLNITKQLISNNQ